MAKNGFNYFIKTADDLVTSREQTKARFITMALEKNNIADHYIEEARVLKFLSGKVTNPKDLLKNENIRAGLITASGYSEKSLDYVTDGYQQAGNNFIDTLVYHYLLYKGEALYCKTKNLDCIIGERKFIRSLLSVFNLSGIDYQWKDSDTNTWLAKPSDDTGIEKRIKGLYWSKKNNHRLLVMNIAIPTVQKNIDLTILDGTTSDLKKGNNSIIHATNKYIALGELKGGIDPAGADEHWKTAKSSLIRIRNSFNNLKLNPKTFFIGAAIEKSMANEMFSELQTGVLNNAANLTNDEQLTAICEWIINL